MPDMTKLNSGSGIKQQLYQSRMKIKCISFTLGEMTDFPPTPNVQRLATTSYQFVLTTPV